MATMTDSYTAIVIFVPGDPMLERFGDSLHVFQDLNALIDYRAREAKKLIHAMRRVASNRIDELYKRAMRERYRGMMVEGLEQLRRCI